MNCKQSSIRFFSALSISALSAVILLSVASASAEQAKDHLLKPVSKDLASMKKVVGLWEGTKKDEQGELQKIQVEYFVTSGGSAVVERLFKGSPHEMVSVYHDDGEKLVMTHYCGFGNQPTMSKKSGDVKSQLHFEFSEGRNMGSEKDPHMHALTISFLSEDKIKHSWQMFKDGKKAKTEEFELTRVQ